MALFSDDWRLIKDAGGAHRTIGAATEEEVSTDEAIWSGVVAHRVMVFHPVLRRRTGRALCGRIHAELGFAVFGRLKEMSYPGRRPGSCTSVRPVFSFTAFSMTIFPLRLTFELPKNAA
jgi:hypothetical protein